VIASEQRPVHEATHEAVPFRPDRSARRFAWIPKVAIAVTIVMALPLLLFEAQSASGPIGYSLQNQASAANPLVNLPQLRISSGGRTQNVVIGRTNGGLARIGAVDWSLEELLTVEFVPAFPTEPGRTLVVDLRRGGANGLSHGWFVRIDVVATDTTFEIAISQPVSDGYFRSREVTQRVSIPRANERRLVAAREAEAAERRAADESRQEAQRARSECVREETATRRAAVAPITNLQTLLQGSLERRRFNDGGTITFDEYRRRINGLVSDMQGHLRDAERALGSEPKPATGEFERLIRDYRALRQAWVDFERALRSPRSGPQTTFQELYPVEAAVIDREFDNLNLSAADALGASTRIITSEVAALCDSLHPVP
jgi:hypothetical protein